MKIRIILFLMKFFNYHIGIAQLYNMHSELLLRARVLSNQNSNTIKIYK